MWQAQEVAAQDPFEPESLQGSNCVHATATLLSNPTRQTEVRILIWNSGARWGSLGPEEGSVGADAPAM
jgi:hypothetical protein